jgi:repressor LexA
VKVGDKIKKLRKSKGLTQAQLAKMLDVVPTAVSAWERNENRPLMDKLTVLAEIFGVSVQTFFNGEDFKSQDVNLLIPLVGTICAGDGLLAEQNIEEYIYYPFRTKRQPDYALRVKGDSMIGAGIEDGDIVYMRQAPWADYNGQIVAALINDNVEGTLKRIRWSADSPLIRLEPENEEYDAIEVAPNQVTICGVYMGHFKPEREV